MWSPSKSSMVKRHYRPWFEPSVAFYQLTCLESITLQQVQFTEACCVVYQIVLVWISSTSQKPHQILVRALSTLKWYHQCCTRYIFSSTYGRYDSLFFLFIFSSQGHSSSCKRTFRLFLKIDMKLKGYRSKTEAGFPTIILSFFG